MKIIKLILDGYNYLKFSGVDKLSIDVNNPVQVIIGDNGSGKSKLMAMFAAKPPQSTLFNKKGGMELHIDHDNHEYIMSYDAATKKHSFIQDTVELNDSYTSGVSEELAASHLNYTKVIDKLIFNKMRLSQMTSAARMEFLTSINPINIKFMKDKYVKITSQLKKTKAQLELLYKRSAEYKSAMMDVESYDNFVSELEQLKRYDNTIIQLIYRYETLLSTVDTQDPIFDRTYYRDNLKKLTKFRLQTSANKYEVSYESIDDLNSQRATITFKLNESMLQMEQLSKEIDELDQLVNTSHVKSLSALEDEYTKYKDALASFRDFTNELIIDWPPSDQDSPVYGYIHQLTELTYRVASDHTSPVWNTKKYRFHKDRYQRLIHQRDDTSRRIQALNTDCMDMTNNIERSSRLRPATDCVSTACALKNRYDEVIKQEQSKITACKLEITQLTAILTKCNRILQLYHTLLPYQDLFHHRTGVVHGMLSAIQQISSSLLVLFPQGVDSIVEAINKNHNGVMEKVKHTLQVSNEYYEMINIKNKLKELDLVIQARKKDVSIEFAKKKISQNYIKLKELDTNISGYRSTLACIEATINYENKVQQGISKTRSVIASIDSDIVAYEGQAKRIAYSSIRQQLLELHNHVSSYIRDIETIVDKQKKILELYALEYASIQKLETLVSELTTMEQALNPYTGLPSIYTRAYIDQILQNVNYIISQVFTYKLEVGLVEGDVDTKYKFNVMVHDVPAGDISNCSDGQMEIIDFAFTVSLMIALGIHKTHPLFLDEIGRCQDTTHAQKLLETILYLTKNGYINQLFIINHQAVLLGGFDNADVICLRSENIMLPEVYNTNVTIN